MKSRFKFKMIFMKIALFKIKEFRHQINMIRSTLLAIIILNLTSIYGNKITPIVSILKQLYFIALTLVKMNNSPINLSHI